MNKIIQICREKVNNYYNKFINYCFYNYFQINNLFILFVALVLYFYVQYYAN